MSRTFYILRNGHLTAEEGVFRFDKEDGMARIPIEQVRAIEMHGGCSVTSGALRLAGKHNVPLHFFDYYSNFMGTYWPKESHFSGDLTIKQSLLYSDDEKRMNLSLRLVKGSMENMIRLLGKFNGDVSDFGFELPSNSIESLMLTEARIRREYYARLDQILPEEFMLMRRERRPPTNFGNCLVSFGNSLLYTAIVTEARKTSVNITIPFYHSPASGRFSLALDLSEPFKPGIVDRFILQITRQGIIKGREEHFHKEGAGILLNERGRKLFLQKWDEWLDHAQFDKRFKRKVSNRELLRFEIHKFAKEVEGMDDYEPVYLPRD